MKPTKKQIKINMQRWLGWQCILLEPHLLANKQGTVKEIKEINKILHYIIKLEDGSEIKLKQGKFNQVMFLEPLTPIN